MNTTYACIAHSLTLLQTGNAKVKSTENKDKTCSQLDSIVSQTSEHRLLSAGHPPMSEPLEIWYWGNIVTCIPGEQSNI